MHAASTPLQKVPDTLEGGHLCYVGHATVLVELDGVRLLTDPMLRGRVFHLRRHGAVAADAYSGVDAVLISHAHWDHLDPRSLALLGPGLRLVVPRGVARILRRRRVGEIVEVDVGESADVGGLTVTATPAEHDAGRGPLGVDAPALGYVISGSKRIYFAGDTDLFPGMAGLAPLDVALLPVAGWGPRLPPGHLNARRAAEALRLLEPRTAVPIHWGTYSLVTKRRATTTEAREPAEEFKRLAGELAPNVDVRVLGVGETLDF